MLRKLLILVLHMQCSLSALAQLSYRLQINAADKDSMMSFHEFGLQTEFKDREACRIYIERLPGLLQARGFIAASVDSVHLDSLVAEIWLFTGKAYHWGKVTNRIDPVILDALQWNDTEMWKHLVHFEQVNALQEQVVDYCTMHGYPFAKVQLDSVHLVNDRVEGVLQLKKGMLYRIDSIRLFGNAKISKSFLSHYLDLAPGSLYDQSKLKQISKRLMSLSYLQEQQTWQVSMMGGGAIIDLFLMPKRSNQVDGMVGILPVTNSDGVAKTKVVGDLKLQLQNAFGNGESLQVNWQQLQQQSPRLNLAFNQPYLFHSPVGNDVSFDLFKKDSSYLNINFKAGASWTISGQQTGQIFVQFFGSNLLNLDTTTVKLTKKLPDQLDMGVTSLGAQYSWHNTDYLYNPRRGNEFELLIQAGKKNIHENASILQLEDSTFKFGSLYDTVRMRSNQFKAIFSLTHYFQLGKLSSLKAALNGGWLESPQIFRNEMFQLGGHKLLRGFDEESIYASSYSVAILEYRLLMGLNSYFFGFLDGGLVRNKSIFANTAAGYLGAGFGLNFETKAGLFNVSLAIGKAGSGQVNLGNTKVHIGYVNFF